MDDVTFDALYLRPEGHPVAQHRLRNNSCARSFLALRAPSAEISSQSKPNRSIVTDHFGGNKRGWQYAAQPPIVAAGWVGAAGGVAKPRERQRFVGPARSQFAGGQFEQRQGAGGDSTWPRGNQMFGQFDVTGRSTVDLRPLCLGDMLRRYV